MRAAVLASYGEPLDLVDRPDPRPGEGQVVVDVAACGVCGSDVFLRKGGFASTLPIVPGHEASGVVTEVGAGVTSVAPGQPVAIYYIEHCGDCELCRAGRVNMCLHVRRMGVDFDGAFADRVLVPAENVIAVNADDDPAAIAVLTDAVATPYHGLVRVGRARPDETVVVFGIGGIGSNAVQIATHLGCRVVAVSRSESKLRLAQQLGAETCVTADDDVVENVRAVCGPAGPDIVVQTVGSAAVDEQAIAAVGVGGRVVLIGASLEPFRARAVDFIWKEATVHGSRGFVPDDIREVIDLYRAGVITTDHLVADRRPLAEANAALADLESGRVLRSVLVFGEGWSTR
ncbi:MAG: zinc-binding dehydrogenase [Acidimicrobiia bacterium]|nr:zinc-binding dehydrogenase [Acidimicrobiia bacterium]